MSLRTSGNAWPRIEISESEKEVQVTAELPGLYFGVRIFAFARSTLACNFLRSTTAAALVAKKLLARRRVWPFRTYHSKEPSAQVCRRTKKSPSFTAFNPPPLSP